jgi:hypothetical protein
MNRQYTKGIPVTIELHVMEYFFRLILGGQQLSSTLVVKYELTSPDGEEIGKGTAALDLYHALIAATFISGDASVDVTTPEDSGTLRSGDAVMIEHDEGFTLRRTVGIMGGESATSVYLDRPMDVKSRDLGNGYLSAARASFDLEATDTTTGYKGCLLVWKVFDGTVEIQQPLHVELVDFVAIPLVNPCTVGEFLTRWPGFTKALPTRYGDVIEPLLGEAWEIVADRIANRAVSPHQILSLDQFRTTTYNHLAGLLMQSGFYPPAPSRETLRQETATKAEAQLSSALGNVRWIDLNEDKAQSSDELNRSYSRAIVMSR